MTEHSDEAKVRAAWENIGEYSYGGATRYVYLADLQLEFSGVDQSAAWSAAAAYTDAHAKKIAEVDEEISVIEDFRAGCISTTDEHTTVTRILARLQAARAELMRGWSGK